jgi:hypothetical protein
VCCFFVVSKAAAWYISFSQLHVPAAAFSDDPAAQIAGVRFIRLLLSRKAAPVKEVIEANVLGRIAALLGTEGNPNLLFECAWALTNVAASEYTQNVVDLGVIPMLGALLASGEPDLREQCMWCLGNVAGDCAALRDTVIATPGAVENLLRNIQHPATLSLLRTATWTLSNLCRGKPDPSRKGCDVCAP